MDHQQAKDFTINIFNEIVKAQTVEEIQKIENKFPELKKNRMDMETYPKIEFCVKPVEIQHLIDRKIIDANLNFTKDINDNLSDTLTKVLYAIVWKNGDLKKVKHILQGIRNGENQHGDDEEQALVFNQFGKYLTKAVGQPIIDQHVIRAFLVYTSIGNNIGGIRELTGINKKHQATITDYKKWLVSDILSNKLKSDHDYTYHIDKLLFATGKTIKIKKSKIGEII